MRHHRLFVLLTFSSLAGLAVYCGGDNNQNPDGGNDATTNDASGMDVVVADTGSDTSNNDTGTMDAGADGCAMGMACRACCDMAYPTAAMEIRTDEQTCACSTPGDCEAGAVCGNNLCMNKAASMACTACLRDPDAGGCQAAAVNKCKGDTACAPYVTCIGGCGGTPPKDAGGD
jgi:hypothetical protein